jgi:hypothetical protein
VASEILSALDEGGGLMDITDALAPKSDQLDAVELVNPRTFTIDTGSRLGTREGATVAEIRFVGFPRWWRPEQGHAGCPRQMLGHGRQGVGRSQRHPL